MPLYIPESYNRFNLVGLDPGINFTGVSVYTLDHGVIESIRAFTIRPNPKDGRVSEAIDIVGERYIKLKSLSLTIESICNFYNPSVVVCEGPFYSRFRPMAYASLVETLSFIRNGVYSHDPYIEIPIIQPLLIKKTIGAGIMSGKVDVTRAITNKRCIMDKLTNPLDSLDEHSQDAIAIMYTYLNLIGDPSCS